MKTITKEGHVIYEPDTRNDFDCYELEESKGIVWGRVVPAVVVGFFGGYFIVKVIVELIYYWRG